jgi:hypothetical protein
MKEDEMSGECNTHGGMRNEYKILVGNPQNKRLIGRPRHGWENNIKINIREIGLNGVDWFDLA